MTVKTLKDLFIHSLSDVYSAEKQLTRALPRLARSATTPELRQAFEQHLEETQGQIERIDRLVENSELRLKRVKCVAMEGLVEEGREQIDEIEKGAVLDAALIGAAQKVEHYEIATYGTLCALAKQLGMDEAAKLETKGMEQATSAIDELGKMQKDSLAYLAQLTTEWRKLTLEATKRTAELFAARS
jgi:ferritin-like metal-binding protein YciE